MQFGNGHLYHIYNRGNNSQKIFFTKENYLFFLKKIKTYILPHADILAWCLMPSHFHLMVYVRQESIPVGNRGGFTRNSEGFTRNSEGFTRKDSEGFTLSETLTKKPTETSETPTKKNRSLNHSIGIMLRSYTRAIQKQQKITGSLFQKESKAICLTEIDGVTPAWFQTEYGTMINIPLQEKAYPQACFDYIHGNPVKDGLVRNTNGWEFSSARDYAGFREGSIVNFGRAGEMGLNLESE